MNGRALVVTVGFLLSCLIPAPATARLTWEAGVRAGPGLSRLHGIISLRPETVPVGDSTITLQGAASQSRAGFVGGAFAAARVSDAFALRLEVLYAQKGAKGTLHFPVDSAAAPVVVVADLTFKLDYVEIPLLAVCSLQAGRRATVDLFGGPAVAFKSSAKLQRKAAEASDEVDIGDTVKSTDFGIALGGGLSTGTGGRARFMLEGRWTIGMVDFSGRGSPLTGDVKHSALAFTGGLSFPLGAAR